VTPEERIAKLRKLAENAVLVSGRHWRGYRFDTVGGFYDTSVADVVLDVLDALTTAERERDERDRTIAALMRGLRKVLRHYRPSCAFTDPWDNLRRVLGPGDVAAVLRALGEP
jgi:hypothetical protein